MKLCPKCNELLHDEAKLCPTDGTDLSAVVADPRLGSVVGDRYVLLEQIGEGNSGTIYRAEHVLLRSKLAIKMLHDHVSADESLVDRFREEAMTVARLDSPHIVRISDFGRTSEGKLFFAMDLLEGQTLASLLAEKGTLSETEALFFLEQLADALSEAHEEGLIHRDIRPRNIFISQKKNRQTVKLLDFGLAKLSDTSESAQTLRAGSNLFDPRYMSPEQARGEEADSATDIYSLALVAYEMVSGAPPHDAEAPFDVLTKHIETQPISLLENAKGISAAYATAVDRALSKDITSRFPSVQAFVDVAAGRAGDDETKPALRQPTIPTKPVVAETKAPKKDVPKAPKKDVPKAPEKDVPKAVALPDNDVGSSATLMGRGPSAADVMQALKDQESAIEETLAADPEPAKKPLTYDYGPATAKGRAVSTQALHSVPPFDDEDTLAKQESTPEKTTPEKTTPQKTTPQKVDVEETDVDGQDLKPSTGMAADAKQNYGASAPAAKREVPQAEIRQQSVSGTISRPKAAPSTTQKATSKATPKPKLSKKAARKAAKKAAQAANREPTVKPVDQTSVIAGTESSAPKKPLDGPLPTPALDDDLADSPNPESGEWFAAGVAAENALGRKGSGPLPAIYDEFDDGFLDGKSGGLSKAKIIAIGAGGLLLVGGILFALVSGGNPETGIATPGQDAESVRDGGALVTRSTDTIARKPDIGTASTQMKPSAKPDAGTKPQHTTKTAPPVAKKPVAKTLVAKKPVAKKPVAKKPVAKKPVAKKPVAKKPVAKKPVAKKPAAKKPAAKANSAQAKQQVKEGRHSLSIGSYQKAKDAFSMALGFDARNADAHGGLGEVAFELGQHRSAVKHLKAAIRLKARVRFIVMLGNVYFKLGQLENAVKEYRRALNKSPDHAAARRGLDAALKRLAKDN